MPRHGINDAHEWINEIPTVPTNYLAKPPGLEKLLGKEDPAELDSGTFILSYGSANSCFSSSTLSLSIASLFSRVCFIPYNCLLNNYILSTRWSSWLVEFPISCS